MNTVVSKRSLIVTIIIALIATLICTVIAYFVGVSSARGESIKQYRLTEDVLPGHSFEGKYEEAYVSVNDSVDIANLVVDASIIDKGVASTYMYKNSPITVSSVTALENMNRNFEVAIPITVEGSVANSIKEGDLVAVKLTYKDAKKEDATVISQIKVKSIKTSNGEDIIDGSAVAAFVIFDVTDEEQSDIKNALKEGNLYCSKYNNLSQKPLQKTYQVSDSQSSEVNPNDNTNTPQQ